MVFGADLTMKNWEFWKNHEGQPKTWERIGKYVENA
jgi:hypothetical protein